MVRRLQVVDSLCYRLLVAAFATLLGKGVMKEEQQSKCLIHFLAESGDLNFGLLSIQCARVAHLS